MRGVTHMICGAAVYGTAAKAGFVPFDSTGFIAPMVGALLPDIDHQGSALGRKLWPISMLISRFTKHRGMTHSLLALGLVVIGLMVLSVFIAPQMRGVWVFGFGLGYASHILADMLTVEGVELFWPDAENIRLLGLKTGGVGEFAFTTAMIAWMALLFRLDIVAIWHQGI